MIARLDHFGATHGATNDSLVTRWWWCRHHFMHIICC